MAKATHSSIGRHYIVEASGCDPKIVGSVARLLELLVKAGVVVTPGNGFGASGEGFVRAAFTVNVDRIREAMDRIRKLGIRGS